MKTPLLLILALSLFNPMYPADTNAESMENTEFKDRVADQAASDSQAKAEKSLLGLILRYKGTSQEAVLRMKLAEVYQQMANLQFRIGRGHATPQYKSALQSAIREVTLLLKKEPQFSEADLAYFLRGKSYEELNDKKNAKKDYLTLVQRFPIGDVGLSALMSLADFATEDGLHEESLGYIKKVELFPDSPQYPFALFKGAWNYYNIRNIPDGVRYLERHLTYYRQKGESAPLSTSDQAVVENTLMDLSLFFFDGFEMQLYRFGLADAYPYLKDKEDGTILGRMFLRFSRLLRAHGHTPSLLAFKDTLIEKEPSRPETLEVAMTYFEDQLNKHQYSKLGDIALDFVKLQALNEKAGTLPQFEKAQKLVIDTSDKIQKLIVKNKKATEIKTLSRSLASLYDTFTKMVREDDPRVAKAHYNLAETLFAIQDFSGAAEQYRWVILNTADHDLPEYNEALIRAVASRYEVLKSKNLIPTEIKAKNEISDSAATVDPVFSEWLSWLKESKSRLKKIDENFLAFEFDSLRTLYSLDKVATALTGLHALVKEYPHSKFYIPAASLILDTTIASKLWDESMEFSDRELKRKTAATEEFKNRLNAVSADSFYKLIEIASSENNWDKVASLSERCTEKYENSPRTQDCLLKGAAAHLKTGDSVAAKKQWNRVIASNPNSDAARISLFERAQLAESEGSLPEAIQDYQSYLGHPESKKLESKKLAELKDRILQLAVISDDWSTVAQSIQGCVTDECKKHEARLAIFTSAHLKKQRGNDVEQIQKSIKAPQSLRAYAVLGTLESIDKIGLRDLLTLTTQLVKSIESLDFPDQVRLYPRIRDQISRALTSARHEVELYAKINPSKPQTIKNRIEWVKEFEKVAAQILELQWSEFKVLSLYHSSEIYREFVKSLTGGLSSTDPAAQEINEVVFPFEEKSHDLLQKAFEIAARDAIDPQLYQIVFERFSHENPSQKKDLAPPSGMKLFTKFDWSMFEKAVPSIPKETQSTFEHWKSATQRQHAGTSLFFLKRLEQQIKDDKLMAALRSYTWSQLSLRSQAFLELKSIPELETRRIQIWVTLGAKSHLKDYLKKWSEQDWKNALDGKNSEIILSASEWTGNTAIQSNRVPAATDPKDTSRAVQKKSE